MTGPSPRGDRASGSSGRDVPLPAPALSCESGGAAEEADVMLRGNASSSASSSSTTAAATTPAPLPTHTNISSWSSIVAEDLYGVEDNDDGIAELGHVLEERAGIPETLRTTLLPLRTLPDTRMSVNPAYAIQDDIQNSAETITSPADGTSSPSRHLDSRSQRATARDSGVALLPLPPNMASMANMDGALPENDGMQALRHQLQEIKMLAVSTEEKAQRMHFLMTQDYLKHQRNLPISPASSPAATSVDVNEPISPVLGAAALPIDPDNPYNLRPGDLDPVFSPLPRNTVNNGEEDLDETVDEDGPELGCMHYKRNVKVQCFDCQRWFPCRHCHDQSNELDFAHSLRRKVTQNMLCMLCQTPQPAAEICIECGEYAAWYYCSKCKLWDNDSNKRIYHCDDCGICRVGEGLGKDFVHCRRCNVCISISTKAAHPCIERATEGNCPLCLIPLFESRTSVVSLPCGHYMHGDCYKDLMAVTYRCPVCSKSAVNMELQWRKLDDEIAAQPMPENDEDLDGVLPHLEGHLGQTDAALAEARPYRPREVWVGCNDCGSRSWTPFHWLGFKCQRCDSYNTNQMAPTAVYETETERLLRQHQIHRHEFTGNAVLRDAGIGVTEPEEVDRSTLEVSKSPSQQPTMLSSSHRSTGGAHSPGRYFVFDNEPRRPSFTAPRFSAPSMPNLPTLSTLADMPRMPRMPNLPHLPNFRQNLPNMPNVELPRFRPYEMIDAVSRSLSPMRYYLRGLDAREDEAHDARVATRPTSVQSDPARRSMRSRVRTSSSGSAAVDPADLWATDDEASGDDSDDEDSIHALDPVDDESSDNDSGEASDDDDDHHLDDEVDGAGDGEEWELIGHR